MLLLLGGVVSTEGGSVTGKRLAKMLMGVLLAAFVIAPTAVAGGPTKAPEGVWSGPGDHEGDLGILVISSGGVGKQPAMYVEKIVGVCGLTPGVFYDGETAMAGNILTVEAPFVCSDTGDTPEGFEGLFPLQFEYDAKADTWTLVDETPQVPMEHRCLTPSELPMGHGEDPVNVIDGTGGDDILVGTDGDDEINGFGGIDILCGFGGKDHLVGGGNVDVLLGGSQKDDLRGKAGFDYLDGGPHKDKLFGNNGNDFLHGDSHDDKLQGGGGVDVANGGKHKPDGDKCNAETETKCELDF